MSPLYIPGKVVNNHLFIKAKVVDLTITSAVRVSIKDFPIPISRELIEKMLRGELMGPPIDLFLSLVYIQKHQQGEITSVPGINRFIIESEGWFLVDTGASSTLINLEAFPLNVKSQISREVSWILERVQAITVTDRFNLPICKATIEVEGKKLMTNKAFIMTRGQNYYHLLGMDILTYLGKSVTLDLTRQRLCIS